MERWWAEVRVLGAIGGVVCLGIGWWASLFALLIGAMSMHRPDPTIPDGDPCCSHPDTWGEVASGSAAAVAAGLAAAAIAGWGARLLWSAAIGRTPDVFERHGITRRAALVILLGVPALAAPWTVVRALWWG